MAAPNENTVCNKLILTILLCWNEGRRRRIKTLEQTITNLYNQIKYKFHGPTVKYKDIPVEMTSRTWHPLIFKDRSCVTSRKQPEKGKEKLNHKVLPLHFH